MLKSIDFEIFMIKDNIGNKCNFVCISNCLQVANSAMFPYQETAAKSRKKYMKILRCEVSNLTMAKMICFFVISLRSFSGFNETNAQKSA